MRDKNAYTFTVRCDRISRHGRPGKSSEIPVEMPSKDPTSESFRVPLSLPWMSRIQGAIRAVRRKNRTLFPGRRGPNLRLLSTSRVNLATFRAHRRRHFAKTSPQPSSGISEVSLLLPLSRKSSSSYDPEDRLLICNLISPIVSSFFESEICDRISNISGWEGGRELHRSSTLATEIILKTKTLLPGTTLRRYVV